MKNFNLHSELLLFHFGTGNSNKKERVRMKFILTALAQNLAVADGFLLFSLPEHLSVETCPPKLLRKFSFASHQGIMGRSLNAILVFLLPPNRWGW